MSLKLSEIKEITKLNVFCQKLSERSNLTDENIVNEPKLNKK